jgi:hypothetical protein
MGAEELLRVSQTSMAMTQEPKLEVPTIYKAYVSTKYGLKTGTFMYLHFRILEFPLKT